MNKLVNFHFLQSRTHCSTEKFSKHQAVKDCPLDCQLTSYESRRTVSSFLHNPERGFEPTLVLREQMYKLKNSSYLLHIKKDRTMEQFEKYIQ